MTRAERKEQREAALRRIKHYGWYGAAKIARKVGRDAAISPATWLWQYYHGSATHDDGMPCDCGDCDGAAGD